MSEQMLRTLAEIRQWAETVAGEIRRTRARYLRRSGGVVVKGTARYVLMDTETASLSIGKGELLSLQATVEEEPHRRIVVLVCPEDEGLEVKSPMIADDIAPQASNEVREAFVGLGVKVWPSVMDLEDAWSKSNQERD